MCYLLTVFGKKGYAEYRLPLRRNADYSLWLSDEVFQINEPLQILLENLDDHWYIRASSMYFFADGVQRNRRLIPGDRFDLITIYEEIYTFSVCKMLRNFHPYSKFIIKESMTIGRGEENDIVIRNQKAVSREHARITKEDGQWEIESKSINGLYVNEKFVEVSAELIFGDYINVMGLHLVFLKEYIAVETGPMGVEVKLQKVSEAADDTIQGTYSKGNSCGRKLISDGKTVVHRSPRNLKEINTSPIEIDAPPEPEESNEMPVVMVVLSNILMTLPMAAGSLFLIYASEREGEKQQLYMYSGLIMALASLVTALLWVIIQNIYNKNNETKRWKFFTEVYHAYLREKEEEIKKRCEETRKLLEERYISAEGCMDIDTFSEILWNRVPGHKDFLDCRLGVGNMDLPAGIMTADQRFQIRQNDLFKDMENLKEKYKTLTEIPVLVSLEKHSQIGLAARSERDRLSLARNMIIQLSFNNCYTETKIGLVYDAESSCYKESWDFMRWLPHVWSENEDFRLLASSHEEARSLFYRLLQIIKKRKLSEQNRIPSYILFIAAPQFLEGEPIEKYLTEKNNRYGIIVIWLASERELLPNSCEFIVEKNREFQGFYHLQQGKKTPVHFDALSGKMADSFSRRLSLLKVNKKAENNEIPLGVTFFQMLGIDNVGELKMKDYWKKNRIVNSLRAPVGLKAGGKKKYLDIHEKYHGPHGLIAGTTGSGKSELLQTYILSLLILYSPESVNLFLIDYKGGGMSGLFDGLPHLCGQISNLSGGQIARAMTALRSENQRRQRLFQSYKVNSISAYMRLYYNRYDMEPAPHLLIIIDEFAELKKEEPDFMQELISIAQVGRSLGLHLILATQKPGGTVDDKIWSNARFRMCLRVQERQDSIDMLHRPDAADIQQTGRCCFQVGNDEIYEIFQTGWSGAICNREAGKKKSLDLIRLSGEEDTDYMRQENLAEADKTQFEAVKEYIIKTADEEGYIRGRQLWMDPLPKQIFLSGMLSWDGTGCLLKERDYSVCIGLVDDPENQRQFPAYLSLESHTVICGLPMTGKSTLLQTVLYGITSRYTAQDIHVYAIDYSNAVLKSFESMPQVGGVIVEGEEQKCQTFFYMLLQILEERRKLFAGANYIQYIRTRGEALARIVVVIDNFSSFSEKTRQSYEGILLRLCKEGENAGITLIVSCGGFSAGELPMQLSSYFKEVFCLEMKEYFSYSEILGTLDLPVFPEKGVRGRGIARIGERILEFQTALAVDSADDYERMRIIKADADRQRKSYSGILPLPVRSVPEKPAASDFYKMEEVNHILDTRNLLPVGYWERTAEIVSVNTEEIYCYLIGGRKKSGKHNFMQMFIETLKHKRSRGYPEAICIVDYSGRFKLYRNDTDIMKYLDNSRDVYEFFAEMTEIFQNRKQQSIANREGFGNEKDIQKETCASDHRVNYYILIENLSLLLAAAKEEHDMTGFLENIWEKGFGLGIIFIGLIEEEDYLMVSELRSCQAFCMYGTGVHFGGNIIEDSVFEHGFLSYEEQTAALKQGTGYLFGEGDFARKIIVPKAEA